MSELTNEQRIHQVETTMDALLKNAPELQGNANVTIQAIEDAEGKKIGVRLLFIVNPTIQLVYVPQDVPHEVAAWVFPGDDAAWTSKLLMMVGNALRSIPELGLELVVEGVIAPLFQEDGSVSFTADGDQVYDDVLEQCILAKAQAILEKKAEAEVSQKGIEVTGQYDSVGEAQG